MKMCKDIEDLLSVAGASLLGGLVWIYPPHVCKRRSTTDAGAICPRTWGGSVKPAAFYITNLMRRELGWRATLALPMLDFFRTNSNSGACASKYFTLATHGMRVSLRVIGR